MDMRTPRPPTGHLLLLLAALWVGPVGCGNSQLPIEPCLEVDCAGHGTCVAQDTEAACVCDIGYYPDGLTCWPVDVTDPCAGISCSGHGECQVGEDGAVCACDAGYRPEGLACLPADPQALCDGITCSGHGDCQVVDSAPACACDEGFAAQGLACVPADPCLDVGCSDHGACSVHNGAPRCDCDAGFHQSGLDCIPDDQPSPGPVWFVHISDLHFGESGSIAATLGLVLDEVLPAVEPAATIDSGDVTDVGSDEQWSAYRAVVDGTAPAHPAFVEVPGNHDAKEDHADKFLAQSVTGRAGGGFYGQDFIDAPGGRVRILRTNTADSSTNLLNLTGIFGAEQAAALATLEDSEPASPFPVVVGHHPMTGLERLLLGFDRMQDLLLQTGARVYFCGHVHIANLSWLGATLVVRAASLGKSDPPSFALVAIDDGGPSARIVPLDPGVDWPLVLITAPADPELGRDNPFARPVSPGEILTLRAIAFSPDGIAALTFHLGEASAAGTRIRPHVWEAALTVPAGADDLVVQAEAIDEATARGDDSLVLPVAP